MHPTNHHTAPHSHTQSPHTADPTPTSPTPATRPPQVPTRTHLRPVSDSPPPPRTHLVQLHPQSILPALQRQHIARPRQARPLAQLFHPSISSQPTIPTATPPPSPDTHHAPRRPAQTDCPNPTQFRKGALHASACDTTPRPFPTLSAADPDTLSTSNLAQTRSPFQKFTRSSHRHTTTRRTPLSMHTHYS